MAMETTQNTAEMADDAVNITADTNTQTAENNAPQATSEASGADNAGDVRIKSLRQVVTAAADGAIAAVMVERSMA